MENLESHGKTVEEATLRGLEQLGLKRDEVEVTVIREGRSGLFGLGAEDAIVRITPHEKAIQSQGSDAESAAKDILEKLLGLFGVEGTVKSETQPATEENKEVLTVSLDITGEDLGILIGRRGQTLSALQYIIRLMVSRQIDAWVPIVIDVEGYKERRARALQSFALDMAERVKARGAPFTLEPMPPYERRIVHMALANHSYVTTESIGQGEERKVVIRPKK
jgi:spoIIIJ-associated protein